MLRIVLAVCAAWALAACGGGASGGFIPLVHQSAPRTAMDSPSSLPGDSPSSLPGDSPSSLPGDSPSSLPGARLACAQTFAVDQANCTVAINLNVSPVSDTSTPADLLAGLHPADLQSAYALPSQNPGGTVAIVDAYDDPSAESDLAVYRTAFGLSPCSHANGCLRTVNQSGASEPLPAANAAWDEEISLDLDMVSAVCPKCRILLVEANSPSFDDLGAAEDTAASLGAIAISNSYYGPEWSGETAYDAYYDHPGVAITASSGDQRDPFYPAASPYVTAVGGTSLTQSGGSWAQSAWPDDGAGCSAYESRPHWQQATGCASRSTVDLAAVADPQTGVTIFDASAGGFLVVGGTSVGAPIVAAAYALSGNPQAPAFSYAHPGDFTSVGSAGYEEATGLGSPAGVTGL